MKQRGSFSITTLILLSLRERPATRTRLMQNLTLSYERVENYVDMLLYEGLIQLGRDKRTLSLTSRGKSVLELSEELASLMPPIDAMIKKYSFSLRDPEDKRLHGRSSAGIVANSLIVQGPADSARTG